MRELDDIEAAIDRLPESNITQDDLDRIGVTQEEFERVAERSMDRAHRQWHEDQDAERHLYDDGEDYRSWSSLGY